MKNKLTYLEINPEQPAKASVIWLHGLGASADDFMPIVPRFNLPKHLAIRFVFPQASVQPVTLNNCVEMPAWFDIFGLALDSKQDETGIRIAEQQLMQLVDAEIAQGICANKIVLAGFSQGGALALHTGLRFPQKLAGIMVLSGYLPIADFLIKEKSESNQNTSIFIAHGVDDPVLPLIAGELTKNYLHDAGYHVLWKNYPMAHEVCSAEIKDISEWLQTVLC